MIYTEVEHELYMSEVLFEIPLKTPLSENIRHVLTTILVPPNSSHQGINIHGRVVSPMFAYWPILNDNGESINIAILPSVNN